MRVSMVHALLLTVSVGTVNRTIIYRLCDLSVFNVNADLNLSWLQFNERQKIDEVISL